MPLGELASTALLFSAVSLASITLPTLLLPNSQMHQRSVVEISIGTSVFCASLGLAFQRYGAAMGLAGLLVAFSASRFLPRNTISEALTAWISAMCLLAYIAVQH